MRNLMLAAVILGAVACSPAPGGGGTSINIQYPSSSLSRPEPDRTLAIGDEPTLKVDSHAGSVTVVAGGPGEVVVRSVLRAPSEADLDRIKVTAEAGAGRVVNVGWTAIGDRAGLSVEFTVTAPAATTLDIRTGAGSVEAEGFSRGLLVRTGGGAVETRGVTGDLDLESGAGSVDVTGGKGAVRVKTGGGSIEVTDTTGDLGLESGAGSVTVSRGSGSVKAKTGGGSILARGRGGDLDLETNAGSITARSAGGAVRAVTGGGAISIDGILSGACLAKTAAGSISIRIPADSSMIIDGKTGAGSVDTDLPLEVEGEAGGRRIRGTLGDGTGGTLRIETGGGSLEVRKR